MTKIIGLTGGIGSGKTTVANLFKRHGIPVYIADERAKTILDLPETAASVAAAFGNEVIAGKVVDRKKLAAIVFNNPQKLAQLNAIVHPAVLKDFVDWVSKHSQHRFVVKEAAILFESGTNADCDAVITVTAPIETRISRVMKRDNVSRENVMERIGNQWDDARKIAMSDFVIDNTDAGRTEQQFNEILKKLQNI